MDGRPYGQPVCELRPRKNEEEKNHDAIANVEGVTDWGLVVPTQQQSDLRSVLGKRIVNLRSKVVLLPGTFKFCVLSGINM